MAMAVIRVRIFASHPVARAQYAHLLFSHRDIRLVEGEENFEIGLFDGELSSLDAVLGLARSKFPDMRPLIVSSSSDEGACLHWMLRGVWGVVSFKDYESDLYRAVQSLSEGQFWLPKAVVMQTMQLEARRRSLPRSDLLTEREQEILELLLRRLSNKEIAFLLRINLGTVKFHVGNILQKLKVGSREELSLAVNLIGVGAPARLPRPLPMPKSS
jgi:NarL family two-component system response regulator LiaR